MHGKEEPSLEGNGKKAKQEIFGGHVSLFRIPVTLDIKLMVQAFLTM